MPLPPYLSSAASSRAHHGLLVKLDTATGQAAEDAALLAEVDRCRAVLASAPSSARIATTLIILLHCATMARTPPGLALDLEFALVPALQLAESGHSMRERRMGYLYLAERLPPGHELHLMLINTIRKDLASTSEAHILAGLHAIAHLPGPDLAPAVVPLLSSRRLLEHEVSIVRQRTIQAISALSTAELHPLSLRELARRIRHEDDDSVLASLLRLFAQSLDSGAREPDPARRRRQFDSVFAVAARKMDADSPLVIAAIRALAAIVRTLPKQLDDNLDRLDSDAGEKTDEWTAYVVGQVRGLLAEAAELHTSPGTSQWARACLLETSTLATCLFEVDGELGEGVETLLEHLRCFLVPPPDKGKGRATSKPSARTDKQFSDTANNRILALRCFSVLPASAWQDGLTEAHMAALMGGVDSTDQSVRKETLRLLRSVDRNLPSLTFEAHLEAVRSGRGLPLPPNVDPAASQAQAVAEGRAEAACRALEVADVLSEGLSDDPRGRKLAESVGRISAALRADGTGPDTGVWLRGVQAVISDLQSSPAAFRTAFIEALTSHLAAFAEDSTAAVLVTTAAVEYPVAAPGPTIDALVTALPAVAPSIQELVVIALVPLLARLAGAERGDAAARVADALVAVQSQTIKHMARRCGEVHLIVTRDLVDAVIQRSKTRALNDILDAILSTYSEATRPSARASGASSPASVGMGASHTVSSLRYEAYDAPAGTGSSGRHLRRGSGGERRAPRGPSSPQSPGSGASPRVRSPLSRAAELSASGGTGAWAMGRSALVEPEDLPLDELAVRRGGGDRTPRPSSA